MFHSPGVQVVALVPVAGPVPPPIIVVVPFDRASIDLLGRDEVNMAVDAARRDDHILAGDDLGSGAHHQFGIDALHRVGISRLADFDDAPIAYADVAFDDAPVIDDYSVGDDKIEDAFVVAPRMVLFCPMPSRMTLPPPNVISSP